MRINSLIKSLLVFTPIAGTGTLAYAQDAPGADPAPGPEAAPGDDLSDEELLEAAEEGEGEVIIITGSMISRKQLTTPAPVAIMDKEELDASGQVSIGEILQNIPSQSNAINVQFNNGGDGSTRISLRGLGAARTLVLVNGRRHVPGGLGADASVDLNAIPIAIIERVEVLKDGASAIYGSDAIGGVVNIITRQDFDGTEANVYTGTTQRGGGTVYDVNVVSGVKSDKGSFMFSAGYFEQQDIMAGERDFSRTDKEYDWETNDGSFFELGSSATPEGVIIDYGEDTSPEWDEVLAGDCMTGACFRDPDTGNFRDLDAGGNSDTGTGDLYNYQPDNYLLTPQKRYNFYGQGRWELGSEADAFFETSFTRRKSDQLLASEPLFTIVEGITVSRDNIYNPYGRDFIDIRRRFTEAGNRTFLQDQNTFRLVAGLEGDIPFNNWKWNANYNFGRTQGTETKNGLLVRSRVQNALGPSFISGGERICGTPASPIPDCVPLNLFGGEGTISNAMLDYLTYTGVAEGYTMQNGAQVSAGGKLADIGSKGGLIAAAVGGEYRRLRGGFTPDPITASGDTTGNKGESTGGYYDVYEGYLEVSAVPLVGEAFAEWLELTGAVRAFSYNTFGEGVTWKAGGLWRFPEGVAVRGTYSTAFRAPSIGDLFAGNADNFPLVDDPCDTSGGPRTGTADANCSADGIADDFEDIRSQQRSIVGGNPEVEEETAVIYTAGLVYEPKFLEGLGLTVDYFWMEIDNAIQSTGAGIILDNCYNQSDRTDCDKIERDPGTGLIVVITDTQTNTGSTKTAGVDFQVRYDWARPGMGRLRHNFEGTWLQKYNDRQPDGRLIKGKGIYDIGVFPEWKANFSTLWGLQNYGAGVNVRYIGSFKECQDDSCDTYLKEGSPDFDPSLSRDVDANFTADVFASYEVKSPLGMSRLTLGVNNVLDQDPSVVFNGFLGTSDASTYDFLGRYYYLRYMQSY
jgi:outer membrane receptor protein involved in Fe transport